MFWITAILILATSVCSCSTRVCAANEEVRNSRTTVTDDNGKIVYETTGSGLTDYEKKAFESTFGPLQNYHIEVRYGSGNAPAKSSASSNTILRSVGFIIFLVFFMGYFLPFFINASLAKSRGKSVALMLLLTCIFSWVVTLILAILPKVERTGSISKAQIND
jgi:hypothetical protein